MLLEYLARISSYHCHTLTLLSDASISFFHELSVCVMCGSAGNSGMASKSTAEALYLG
jgi:hypothetical protein